MSNSNELEETTPLSDRIKSIAEKSVPVTKAAAFASIAVFFGAMTIVGLRESSNSSDSDE